MIGRIVMFIALLLAPAVAHARVNAIQPELVAAGPATPGGEVDLAIVMHTSPGWHGYWQNPGDAGLPMDVQWRVPNRAGVGALRYPVPTRLTVGGIMNYVYQHDYAVLTRLTVPANATGVIPIRAEARWLACTDKICVPEQGQLALDLPVGSGPARAAQFDAWRQALPRPLGAQAHFALEVGKLRVAIPLPASVTVDKPYLFPITDDAVDYEAPQAFFRAGDMLIAELKPNGPPPARLSGVIAYDAGRGLEFTAVPGAVPRAGTPVGGFAASAIFWAVLGAIAGGILLNLMPCVFPILALKALHLSRAGGDAGHARSDALAYTAGTIVGTGALGAVLLGIRAAGAEAGWAFQLQDPRTIMLLLLLAVAITANLLGLFELPVVGGGARPAGSFGTGALAAFVATPCAGPFLGAALGTALLLPAAGALLVFAALGLGLAIPFLLVSFVPALRRRVPKPGSWMLRLQRFLAIPMAASAAAALWLLYRLGGHGALVVGLVAGAALLVVLAFSGSLQRQGRRGPLAGAAVALLVVAAGVALVPQRTAAARSTIAGVEPWSEAGVQRHLAAGKPVFVYFTADWCLTCKVNEAGAIDRSEVRDAFRAAGVTVLAGDWTDGDPAITRFLDSRGRAGVPLYLWYAPGKPVEELPQVLTPGMLIARVRSGTPR